MKADIDHLLAGREAAHTLFRATRSDNPQQAEDAAQCLLELAIYATALVEDAALCHPEAFREASKEYGFFPLLIGSKDGRDTRKKLDRVDTLPLGANRPFKRLRARARNDDLREWIERTYDRFQLILQGLPHAYPDGLALNRIQALTPLNQQSARQWAVVMVKDALDRPGGKELPGILGITPSRATQKRASRKLSRIKAQHGGIHVDTKQQVGEGAVFNVRKGDGTEGNELDFLEAMKLQCRVKRTQNMQQTPSDESESFVDAVHKRVQSILK